ncbi:MAG: WbqC family protein, partial [Synergistaceae bacterium]|nr:WbqC family protein [Synergistaceae bacterium]
PYDQRLPEFVPGLSVIDAMMFCSSEEISALLDRFSLLS